MQRRRVVAGRTITAYPVASIRDLERARTLDQRYSRSEVERMTGATRRQLNHWARLGLVRPRSRWGERFFSFSDLVAVETLRRLAERRIPAGKLRRAIDSLERQLGKTKAPLSALRVSTNGMNIVVHEPGPLGRPIEPLTGQLVLNFEMAPLERKLRAMGERTAEQWFEMGMAWDGDEKTLRNAAEAYRNAIKAAPEWVEAHINLGTTLYQMGSLEDSYKAFLAAVDIEPGNALARFNLGCACDRLGDSRSAIHEFRSALERSPEMADAHLNLALTYEKSGRKPDSLRHLSLYLRYEPNGPWADFARGRLQGSQAEPGARGKVTPFRAVKGRTQ